MPVIKDEREDSDGEEMEHESGESDKSSCTSDSSDAASDSDDSSEMDEEECERRRAECMENLLDLERQFTVLREQLYRERITQVETKLEEVQAGSAPEWLQPLKELEENMHVRVEVAGILRRLRLANLRNRFEAEELASLQNYECTSEEDNMLQWLLMEYLPGWSDAELQPGDPRINYNKLWMNIRNALMEYLLGRSDAELQSGDPRINSNKSWMNIHNAKL